MNIFKINTQIFDKLGDATQFLCSQKGYFCTSSAETGLPAKGKAGEALRHSLPGPDISSLATNRGFDGGMTCAY